MIMNKIKIDNQAYKQLLNATEQLNVPITDIASVAIISYIKILRLPQEKGLAVLKIIEEHHKKNE